MKEYKGENWLIEQNVLVIIILIPLIYSNGYFNIVETKANAFIVIQLMFLTFHLLLKKKNKSIDNISILCMLLSFVCLLSCILSCAKKEALWGSQGWEMGTLYWILGISVIIIVKDYVGDYKNVLLVHIGISSFIVVLALINIFGGDPLDIYENIAVGEMNKYLSTVGNINALSEYLILSFPIIILLYLEMIQIYKKVMIMGLFVLYDTCMVLCNSDLALLELSATAIIGVILAILHKVSIKKVNVLICIIIVNHTGLYILYRMRLVDNLGELQVFFVSGIVIIMLVTAILINVLAKVKNRAAIIISLIGTIFFIIAVFFRYESIIVKYCSFNDSWGNSRGRIYRYSFEIFKEQSLLRKIVGNGCDTFGIMINGIYGNEIRRIWSSRLVNAHSYFLQLLLTVGILGTVLFYMIVMFSIHNGVKSGDKWKVCISLILILDILQGMFNNFQPACMPINFIYIGLLNSRMCKVTPRKI